MKKILSLLVIAAMLVTSMAVLAVNAEEDPEVFYRLTALGNDPYCTLEFSKDGKHFEIDPDTVTWASIKYRVNNPVDDCGNNYKGQFYVNPAVEPHVPIIWDVSEGWHTIVVDLTTVSEKTTLSSAWNSDEYTATRAIRFDPLEPDRDAENNEQNGASVNEGDSLDIAWIAFFEKEDEAKAFNGNLQDAYCYIDKDGYLAASSGNKIKSNVYKNGEIESSGTIDNIVISTNASTTPTRLNDHELAIKTPMIPDGKVMKSFSLISCPTWSNKEGDSDAACEVYIWRGDYDSSFSKKPVATCEITNHADNMALKFKFDKELRYGHEYLIVITATNTGNIGYWDGTAVSDTSLDGWEFYFDGDDEDVVLPAVGYELLEVGDLGPEPTEEPTPTPTATPTATPEPTEAPTAAPTSAPTEAPTAAPTEAPAKSGCGSIIGGSFAVVILAACTLVIRKKH